MQDEYCLVPWRACAVIDSFSLVILKLNTDLCFFLSFFEKENPFFKDFRIFLTVQPLPRLDKIDGMSVKALKELLAEHNLSTQGCVKKGDLQKKARALVEPPATPPPAPKPTPPAKAEANGSSEQETPTKWPVDKGQNKFLPSELLHAFKAIPEISGTGIA
jgi:hypothetical protein